VFEDARPLREVVYGRMLRAPNGDGCDGVELEVERELRKHRVGGRFLWRVVGRTRSKSAVCASRPDPPVRELDDRSRGWGSLRPCET
jgi:hypothetical protein